MVTGGTADEAVNGVVGVAVEEEDEEEAALLKLVILVPLSVSSVNRTFLVTGFLVTEVRLLLFLFIINIFINF